LLPVSCWFLAWLLLRPSRWTWISETSVKFPLDTRPVIYLPRELYIIQYIFACGLKLYSPTCGQWKSHSVYSDAVVVNVDSELDVYDIIRKVCTYIQSNKMGKFQATVSVSSYRSQVI
jgi:hypothetical protein